MVGKRSDNQVSLKMRTKEKAPVFTADIPVQQELEEVLVQMFLVSVGWALAWAKDKERQMDTDQTPTHQ